MDEQCEKDLVKRCLTGDRRSFAELVDCHKIFVFNIIDRMIYDKALVEDLAQEVFVRVYQGLPGFQGASRLSTWIYRIAYNVCVAELDRARHRADFVSLDREEDGQAHRLDLKDASQDPEETLARIDFRRTVQTLLARLPPRYRMILTLCYLKEMSYEEIGKVMELPMGTVKTHLHRAKRAMRDMIVEEGLWEEMASGYSARQATQ